jgi:hypothetical protein
MTSVVPFEAAKRKAKRAEEHGGGVAEVNWETAPFEPLGVNGDAWWFVDAYHQVLSFRAATLCQRGPLNVLMAGDASGWAATFFPEFDKEGKATGDYSPRRVHQAIAQRMQGMPLFDPEMSRRGCGVWVEAGTPIIHVGDGVLLPEGPVRPSFVRKGVVWVSDRAIAAPHDGAAGRPPVPGAAIAEEAERRLGMWNWERDCSARMLLGWWCIANLGALSPMRPLALVDGQEEAGKSTLLDTLHAMSPAAEKTNDTTEAGLRQRLQGRAAPVVLDEFEGEQLVRVLGLLRRIVTGDGARAFRGSADQKAIATEVVGTAIMGAIGAPVANAAETTRILELMLWPRAPGVAALDRDEMLGWAKDAGPKLWGRAIAAWPRIRANFAILAPLLERRQASSRNAQMVGWLVAAREAMVSDFALDSDSAEEALGWASPWIVTRGEQAQDSTAARCLNHLMASQVMVRPGQSATVAELITQASAAEGGWDAEKTLQQIGLRLAPRPIDGGGVAGLYVATGRRPGLEKLFAGTEWIGGRWGTVLAQMRAMQGGRELRAELTGKQRVRFSGENDRASAVWLARGLLPGGREDGGGA